MIVPVMMDKNKMVYAPFGIKSTIKTSPVNVLFYYLSFTFAWPCFIVSDVCPYCSRVSCWWKQTFLDPYMTWFWLTGCIDTWSFLSSLYLQWLKFLAEPKTSATFSQKTIIGSCTELVHSACYLKPILTL